MEIIKKSIKPQNFLRFSQPSYQPLLKIEEVSNEMSLVLSKKQLIDLDYKSLPHVLVISKHGNNSLQKTIKRLVTDKMTQVISKIVKAGQSQKNKVLKEITQQITNRITWNSNHGNAKSSQQSQTLDYENHLIKEYLQKLCCELVADETMTKAQSQFLYQCINIGIDLGITRERSLLIGGKYYKIKTGTSYLNQIFKSVMNKKCGTDPNIKRLTEHNPIFVNDSNVLDKAACDYQNVKSIVCPQKTIELNQILLSFLEYKKAKGNKKFCLIEKRNYFGDIVAEKIVSKKSYYSTHPSKKETEEFRQKLFSKTGLGIEFSIRSISISPEQEENIEKLLGEKSKSGNAKYKAYEDIKQMFKVEFQQANQSKLKKWELLNIAKSDPRVTEVRLDNIQNEITDIKGIINTTGLKQQSDFKETLQKLKTISNNFDVYYKIFYWTVMDKIDSYRVASTDVVQKNNKVDQTTSQRIGIQVLKKGGTFVLSAAQHIPLIGGIFEYFNDFVDFVTEEVYDFKFDNQATSVTNIVKLKDSRSELELCIQQTIIKIMELKAKQIEDPSETQEESKIQALIGWFKQKYEKLKQMMIQDKVKAFGEENPVAEIALSDATIFFSVVFKYSSEIMKAIKKQSANPRILTETLIQYFKKGYKQFNDRIDKGLNDDLREKQQQENLESDSELNDEKNMENEFEQKKSEDPKIKKQLQKQGKKPNSGQTKQKEQQKKEQSQQKENKTQKQEIVEGSSSKKVQQTTAGCGGDECQIY